MITSSRTETSAGSPVSGPLDEWFSRVPAAARPWVARLVGTDRVAAAYAMACQGDGRQGFADRALRALGVESRVDGDLAARVPTTGPVIVVANHPFGGVEGLVMASQLLRVRPDVRLMANRLLASIPELRPHLIAVDPFGGAAATRSNLRGVRASLRWLKGGGVLGIFPAGEVAHFRLRDRRVVESDWSSTVAWLARESHAIVVPLHFRGSNGPLFHLAGLVHPALRTALLPRELLRRNRRPLSAVVGSSVDAGRLRSFGSDPEAARYLQFRTSLLSRCASLVELRRGPAAPAAAPIAAAIPPDTLADQIAALPSEHCLLRHREWGVYLFQAADAPQVLREVGRLREATFRAVGEGTGATRDIDRFDAHYRHLILWNHTTRQIVGGYRLGFSDDVVARYGVHGLYTHTLFRYGRPLLRRLVPGIELGRSFVRLEWQRAYLPLLLLWKGLATLAVRDPRRRLLFGTVSMSNAYHPMSRALLVRFFAGAGQRDDWSRWISPRRPLRDRHDLRVLPARQKLPIPDIDTLSETIAAIEPDNKGIPVLLRHYLKLGGRVLGFTVDPAFQSALDAFVVVDLARADARHLELYMGSDGARSFLGACGPINREALP